MNTTLMRLDASHALFANLPFHPMGSRVPADEFSLSKSLEIARNWLEICDSDHELCRTEGPESLPTRVLDVSTSTVQLVSGAGKTERYNCLSHCWGTKPVLETTPETINKFQSSIPWEIIPATFRDAIIFTRAMGLQYIWIDSLCIIQKDDTSIPSDWQKESAKMASIYKNSYVTLAASTSADSTISCFDGHHRSLYKPSCVLKATGKTKVQDCQVFARISLPHALETNERGFFPLLDRAWVLQERLLSPRLIYLGYNELQWECRCTYHCECGAAGDDFLDNVPLRNPKVCFAEGMGLKRHPSLQLDPEIKHVDVCRYCAQGQTNITCSFGGRSINQLYTERCFWGSGELLFPPYPDNVAWRELLRNYGDLQLTYGSDIFPALSGLAHSWHYQHGSHYIAGLWEEHLVHELLWYTHVPCNRPVDWRAPTWSWASLQGCNYGHGSLSQYHHTKNFVVRTTRIEAVDRICDGPDWAGQLRQAQISIICNAIAGTIHHWSTIFEDPVDFISRVRVPCRLITQGVIYHYHAFILDTFIWTAGSPTFLETGSVVYMLPLAITTFNQSPAYTECNDPAPIDDGPVQCLLVVRRGSLGKSLVYERIGTARLEPSLIHDETLVPSEDRILDGDPREWPQLEPPDENERKQELGLVHCKSWQYDAHCKVTQAMREAPLQTFTIV
jgi:hypothetical protein